MVRLQTTYRVGCTYRFPTYRVGAKRFQTAPTALGTPKLTLMVRFQTAPTALGTAKLTLMVRLQTAPTEWDQVNSVL